MQRVERCPEAPGKARSSRAPSSMRKGVPVKALRDGAKALCCSSRGGPVEQRSEWAVEQGAGV